MRSVVLASVMSLGLVIFGLTACTNEENESQVGETVEATGDSIAESAESAGDSIAETADSATDSLAETNESAGEGVADWTTSVKAELSSFDQKYNEWKAEVQGKDTKAEYHEKMAELEKKRVELSEKIEDAGEVSKEKWTEFKSEVESQMANMKKEMDELNN